MILGFFAATSSFFKAVSENFCCKSRFTLSPSSAPALILRKDQANMLAYTVQLLLVRPSKSRS